MLEIGSTAPAFTLPDQEARPVSLAELTRDAALVLYFYPADFTPGCTREACDLRDLTPRLLAAGIRVAGVSPQDSTSHLRFAARHALPFALLADADKRVIRAYAADGPLGLGVRRITYLIDRESRIVDALCADLRIGRHAQFVARAMARA